LSSFVIMFIPSPPSRRTSSIVCFSNLYMNHYHMVVYFYYGENIFHGNFMTQNVEVPWTSLYKIVVFIGFIFYLRYLFKSCVTLIIVPKFKVHLVLPLHGSPYLNPCISFFFLHIVTSTMLTNAIGVFL
jgi:hypothetical protein